MQFIPQKQNTNLLTNTELTFSVISNMPEDTLGMLFMYII